MGFRFDQPATKHAFTITLLTLLVAGCGSTTVVVKDATKTYPPTDRVEILRTTPSVSYERLATIKAMRTSSIGGDRTPLFKEIGKKAKSMGADAVIITQDTVSVARQDVTYMLTGTAIKYTLSNTGTAAVPQEEPFTEELMGPIGSSPKSPASNPPATALPASKNTWLWSQDPEYFTIQLIGSRSEQAIQRYIEEQNLGNQVAYFKTRRNGATWYALVHGSFATKKEAKDAIKKLPPALRRSSPWVRKFADIRKVAM